MCKFGSLSTIDISLNNDILLHVHGYSVLIVWHRDSVWKFI